MDEHLQFEMDESSTQGKNQGQDHTNQQNGIKPHQCNMCDTVFVAKCDLLDHMKVHTGPLAYCCFYCNKSCFSKEELEEHEMQKHLQFEMNEVDDSSDVVVFKLKK